MITTPTFQKFAEEFSNWNFRVILSKISQIVSLNGLCRPKFRGSQVEVFEVFGDANVDNCLRINLADDWNFEF